MVAKIYFEPKVESVFYEDSYGYRVMICRHIDTWYSKQKETFNLSEIIFN